MSIFNVRQPRVSILMYHQIGRFPSPCPDRFVCDDGYANFQEHAWPILQHYGYPATVFLVSGLIGRQATWLGADRPPYLMDATAIQQLHRHGIAFGGHTRTHGHLIHLDEEQQRLEIFGCKAELEDLLGEAVSDFCYPYGEYDARTRALTAEAGYRMALTCIRSAANSTDPALELPRMDITHGDNPIRFLRKLLRRRGRNRSSRPSLARSQSDLAS